MERRKKKLEDLFKTEGNEFTSWKGPRRTNPVSKHIIQIGKKKSKQSGIRLLKSNSRQKKWLSNFEERWLPVTSQSLKWASRIKMHFPSREDLKNYNPWNLSHKILMLCTTKKRKQTKKGKDTVLGIESQHRRSKKNSQDDEVKIRMKENPRTRAMQKLKRKARPDWRIEPKTKVKLVEIWHTSIYWQEI